MSLDSRKFTPRLSLTVTVRSNTASQIRYMAESLANLK